MWKFWEKKHSHRLGPIAEAKTQKLQLFTLALELCQEGTIEATKLRPCHPGMWFLDEKQHLSCRCLLASLKREIHHIFFLVLLDPDQPMTILQEKNHSYYIHDWDFATYHPELPRCCFSQASWPIQGSKQRPESKIPWNPRGLGQWKWFFWCLMYRERTTSSAKVSQNHWWATLHM